MTTTNLENLYHTKICNEIYDPVKIKYYTKIYYHINKLREFKFSPNPNLNPNNLGQFISYQGIQ